MWITRILAALVSMLFMITVQATAQSAYTVTDLGALSPTGINSWGQVVGNYNGHAFIWARGQGVRDLGLLPGGTFSIAADINDVGEITGTADGIGTIVSGHPDTIPNQECNDLTQPFLWAPRKGMQGLGTVGIAELFNSGLSCNYAFYGRAINVSAQVVGDVPVSHNLYAFGFLWTAANKMTLVGSSWPPTFVNDVSNGGQMVGQDSGFYFDYGIGHAASWKQGLLSDLGTLGGTNDFYGSSANGVNDLGFVVGWSTTDPVLCCNSFSPVHAVLWMSSGGLRDLGTLPGDTSSSAVRINFFGLVIGSSGNTAYAWGDSSSSPFGVIGRPFIWSQRTGMRDLNTLIPQNGGWVLQSATDINVWGQIVGQGTLNGLPRGFLLTPRNPFQLP